MKRINWSRFVGSSVARRRGKSARPAMEALESRLLLTADLSTVDLDPDSEFGDDAHAEEIGADATEIDINSGIFSYVDEVGDVDVFQFTPEADGVLTLDMDSFVIEDDGGGDEDHEECAPDAELGDDIHANEIGADATAVELEDGYFSVWSNIDEAGDVDVFSFTADETTTLSVGAFISSDDFSNEIVVEVTTADGTVVSTTDDGFGAVDVTEDTDYFVRVAGAEDDTVGEYWVEVFVNDCPEDHDGDDFAIDFDSEKGDDPHSDQLDDSATELTVDMFGFDRSSYLDEAGDEDVFRFTANEDGTMFVGGWLFNDSTWFDESLEVEVLDADGDVLSSEGMFGEHVVEVTEGTEYFVSVSSSEDSDGGYTIFGFQLPELDDDVVEKTAKFEVLDADGEVVGAVNDDGLMEADLTADETYFLRVSGNEADFTGEYMADLDFEVEEATEELVVEVPETEKRVTVTVKEDMVVMKVGKEVVEKMEVDDVSKIMIKGTETGDKVVVNIQDAADSVEVIEVVADKGNDRILIRAKEDAFDGEVMVMGDKGRDRLIAKDSQVPVEMHGGGGNDYIVGSMMNDILCGDGGQDRIEGLAGKDFLEGGKGADELKGGRGNDMLAGGQGDDMIDGQRGRDLLTETTDANGTLTDTALEALGTDSIFGIERGYFEGDGSVDSSNFGGQMASDTLFARLKDELMS